MIDIIISSIPLKGHWDKAKRTTNSVCVDYLFDYFIVFILIHDDKPFVRIY